MSRKIQLIIIMIIAVSMMVSCNIKEKVGQGIAEKLLEKAVGDEVDIDITDEGISYETEDGDMKIDENGITIKSEEGEFATGGNYEWPKGQAADLLPKLEKGKITSVMNSDTYCMLIIVETEEEDFNKYVKAMKEKGFDQDVVESSFNDSLFYSASSDNAYISVGYTKAEASLAISIEKEE